MAIKKHEWIPELMSGQQPDRASRAGRFCGKWTVRIVGFGTALYVGTLVGHLAHKLW